MKPARLKRILAEILTIDEAEFRFMFSAFYPDDVLAVKWAMFQKEPLQFLIAEEYETALAYIIFQSRPE